jgi:hypothetical protein
MVVACQAFEHSCGEDPLQILLALKFRGDVEPIRDTFAGRTLLKLHAEAKSKHRYYVDFRKRGAEKYYQYRAEPIEEWKGRVLWTGCLVSLFIGLGLMVVGLLTVLTWVSGLIFGI